MELVLIRHAQPAWANPDGISTNDPRLTELGRAQAAKAAAWLADGARGRYDELHTSPAARTRETAAHVERALGQTAQVQPWLLELGMPPDWEGQPETEVVKVLAQLRSRPRAEWWEGPPGGESFHDFHQRVTDGVTRFLAQRGAVAHEQDPLHLWDIPDPGPRILLFAHAGTNSVIIGHLLGVEPQPWEWERFPCDHASISVLRSREIASGAIWALEYFSDVAHLPADAVTA